MDLEREGGEFAELRDQIREEKEILHIMTVGHIEMPAFGEGLDPRDFRGEAREVGGPE